MNLYYLNTCKTVIYITYELCLLMYFYDYGSEGWGFEFLRDHKEKVNVYKGFRNETLSFLHL